MKKMWMCDVPSCEVPDRHVHRGLGGVYYDRNPNAGKTKIEIIAHAIDQGDCAFTSSALDGLVNVLQFKFEDVVAPHLVIEHGAYELTVYTTGEGGSTRPLRGRSERRPWWVSRRTTATPSYGSSTGTHKRRRGDMTESPPPPGAAALDAEAD